MRIKVSGSTGYLGNLINTELKAKGHTTEAINREMLYGPVNSLAAELHGAGAVIHLAGAPMLTRWTEKNKTNIINSRAATARNIVRAIKSLPVQSRPAKVVSASGINIYAPGKYHTDNSLDYGHNFLSELVKKWEHAWAELPEEVELTIFRMAVVLGKKSSAIKNMLLPFKAGLGGKVGNGRQAFPFVHEADVARAYSWAIENTFAGGNYILSAPTQINNETFTKALAKSLNRPAFLTVPQAALKLLYGEAVTMLTQSPFVYPEKLLKKDFQFKYPTIDSALEEIFK